MGGIKNKSLLNKAINKVPLCLKEEKCPAAFRVGTPLASQRCDDAARRQSDKRIVLTKYLGIACLTLAILSTLILNIVSSYSSSKVNSNAEPVTQANSTLVSGDAEISLSISSYPSSSSTGGNNPNLSLSIPQGGGIVTGRHTVSVNSNNYTGYSVKMKIDSDTYSLTDKASSNDNTYIEAVGGPDTLTNPMHLQDNQWGVAFPASTGDGGGVGNQYDQTNQYEQTLSDPSLALSRRYGMVPRVGDTGYDGEIMSSNTVTNNDTQNIYYAVRIDDPIEFPAGDYSTNITLTATTHPVGTPTITSVTPNTYELGSGADSTATITGTNLASTYRVYLESVADSNKQYDVTSSVTNVTDGQLTATLPTDKTNPELEAGEYTLHVVTQGGEDSIGFTYTKPSICRNADSESACKIDLDSSMIPVTYVGYNGNGGGYWAVVNDNDINNTAGSWYDYGKKQWANAATVNTPSKYTNAATGTRIDNNDVKGYWVYIPRYAYEVQRRNAIDAPVSPQNFDIVFQVADEKNTPADTCSTSSSHKDYRTGCGIDNTYVTNSDSSVWATHPAFSWDSTELNGIWVGKYEMTGTIISPTVKPNQHANVSEYIGELYTAAKSIGVSDPGNTGGSTVYGVTQNSHKLATATSHMIKNSEWGAITYLAHSRYGAGINTSRTHSTNIDKNGAHPNSGADADGDSSSYGITGCGPASAGSTDSYTDGTLLSTYLIESSTACSRDASKAYNGSLGVLSSTTNTVYGIYGLSGGASEYVAGNRTSSNSQSSGSTTYMMRPAQQPYADLYKSSDGFGSKPSWSKGTSENSYNYDVCTFETCGGTATYEVTTAQSVNDGYLSWGGTYSNFAILGNPWFDRGGSSDSPYSSPFYTVYLNGISYDVSGTRAVLLANGGGDDGGSGSIDIVGVSPSTAPGMFESGIFTITGRGLEDVYNIKLTMDDEYTAGGFIDNEQMCDSVTHTSSGLRCNISRWLLTPDGNKATIHAQFLSSSGEVLYYMENFCTALADG